MVRIEIQKGQSLWQALKENGIELERPCGGNGLCRGCEIEIKGIGRVKSCQFAVVGTYEVELPERRDFVAVVDGYGSGDVCEITEKIKSRDGGAEAFGNSLGIQKERSENIEIGVAVDIGTTTVVLKLYKGGKSYTSSFVNPQRQFGADVMSRIQGANAGYLEEMQNLLQRELKAQIGQILSDNEIWKQEEMSQEKATSQHGTYHLTLIISANTTMQHIYRGLSCEGLGRAPFSPVTLELERISRQSAGSFGKQVDLEEIYLPGISAYVGADIVSGIYALDMIEEEKPVLLLDLGTNGEMALGCKRKLLVASAAAGPAFEGSELAMKIHAAGIMGVLHDLLKWKIMDENGTLVDKYAQRGDIRITQEDIREIQMAKGAIRAGIEMLLSAYGISAREVDKVYLAGGMGFYLNPEDAVAIGLLPEAFADRIKVVGNSSLQGAVRFLQEGELVAGEKLQQIKTMAKEIILGNTKRFQDLYVKYMNFETI